ncbi:MAG: RNA-binding protein [Chlamydiales bacterium]|nr:RNA-binding protein [Chlamydiia bacterium]MCP5506837.1 RNA-binding protein [Chlamydiales bacterium]
MAKKLFVGNLPHEIESNALQELFESFGTVVYAKVITDRDTGRSKGFGFVELESDDDAEAAIKEMNGKEVGGRPLTVNEARPREDRGGREPRGGKRPFKGNSNRY